MKKVILVIIVAMISSFSYYGAVNENGEKVTGIKTIMEYQNMIPNEIEEGTIGQVVENEETNELVTENSNKSSENVQQKNTVISKQNNQNKPKEKTTQVKETVAKPIQAEEKTITQDNSKQQEGVKETVQRCTNNTNHGIAIGNCNKWFGSKQEAISLYMSELKKWSDKKTNNEIDNETYNKNCPSGYEIWSCPYCQKWTINYYYR